MKLGCLLDARDAFLFLVWSSVDTMVKLFEKSRRKEIKELVVMLSLRVILLPLHKLVLKLPL